MIENAAEAITDVIEGKPSPHPHATLIMPIFWSNHVVGQS